MVTFCFNFPLCFPSFIHDTVLIGIAFGASSSSSSWFECTGPPVLPWLSIFIIVSFPSFLSYQLKQFRITHKFELGNGEQSALILFGEKSKQKRRTNILGLVFFNVSMLCLFIYFYHFCVFVQNKIYFALRIMLVRTNEYICWIFDKGPPMVLLVFILIWSVFFCFCIDKSPVVELNALKYWNRK